MEDLDFNNLGFDSEFDFDLLDLGIKDKNKTKCVPIDLYEEHDDGVSTIYGYVTNDLTQIDNYLFDKADEHLKERILKKFKSKQIGVLKNLYVLESHRGEGIGSRLLSKFLETASDNNCDIVILESDTGENNEFNLTEWYMSFGFTYMIKREDYPLLMLKLN